MRAKFLLVIVLALVSVSLVGVALHIGFPVYYRMIPCSNPETNACFNRALAYARFVSSLPHTNYFSGTVLPYSLIEAAEGLTIVIVILLLNHLPSLRIPDVRIRVPLALRLLLFALSATAGLVYIDYVYLDVAYAASGNVPLASMVFSFMRTLPFQGLLPTTSSVFVGDFGFRGFEAFGVGCALFYAGFLNRGLWSSCRLAIGLYAIPLLILLTAPVAIFDTNDVWLQAANFVGFEVGGKTVPSGSPLAVAYVYGVPLASNMTVLVVSLSLVMFSFYQAWGGKRGGTGSGARA